MKAMMVSAVSLSSTLSPQHWVGRGVWSLALALGIGAGGLMLTGEPARAAESAKGKSWSGTWNNKKFNTTGELTCTVVGVQNGQWIASFTGTGLGRPFKYTALISGRQSGTNLVVQGTTRVDGDNYTWSGTITGGNMTGSFRSTTGNNGQFVLKENPAAPAGKSK